MVQSGCSTCSQANKESSSHSLKTLGGGGCVAEMTDRMGGAVVRDSRCVFGTWVQVNVGKLRDRAVTQLEPCAGVPEVPA